MDSKTITAVALSLAILLGWSYFFSPKQKTRPAAPAVQEAVQPHAEKKAVTPAVKAEAPVKMPVENTVAVLANAENITVDTDLFRAVFSTQGAVITYWEIKAYKDEKGEPVVLLRDRGAIPPLALLFDGPNRDLPQQLLYTSNTKELTLSKDGRQQGELIFSYNAQGVTIKKKFVFYNDRYKVDMSLETVNTPSFMLPLGTNFGIFTKADRGHTGPILYSGTDRKEYDSGLKSPEYITENVRWIAQEDQYFAAAIIPSTEIRGVSVWKEKDTAEMAINLDPQKQDFTLYVGPKEYDRLKQFGSGLEDLVDFGWFAFIAMPLFWVLKVLYKYIGNYGIAIIILTIATRVPFIPILNKSQQSMKKMQKIQPLMAEIKEKYKNDSAKMQKELMAIYKKHKVNPVGGCLPMLLQIPVFIALYNVLLKAIELRGAPFVFWISDLAAKDPYYVLPVVMGLTMLLQQKMTPSTMDPKQAKMMLLMPVVFTFMFLNFASGLVLYWLVNNTLGIVQQYFVNKKAA